MNKVLVPALSRRSYSVGAELAAHLEQLITSGVFKPGQKLPPERELAASLGASRASLREAILELESKRLIERRRGSGSTVLEQPPEVAHLHSLLSVQDIRLENASELRDLVEPGIARLAAARASDSSIISLEKVLLRATGPLTAEESLQLDVEFHLLLAQAAQNPLLVALCTMTNSWTADSRSASHASERGRYVSIVGHHRIMSAVRARDESSAASTMELHLREVRDVVAGTDTVPRDASSQPLH